MAPAYLFQVGTWRWRAIYSAKLHRPQDSIFSGFLWLDPKAKSLKLVDLNGVVVDSRDTKVREYIHPGSTLDFATYRVQVQGRISLVMVNYMIMVNLWFIRRLLNLDGC